VLGFFMLLVSVPIAGYEGFVCFGSWLAVITCVGAWLPVAVAGILLIFGGTELLARGAVGTGLLLLWLLFLGIAALLLWKVVPYSVESSAIWFRWLVGHFR